MQSLFCCWSHFSTTKIKGLRRIHDRLSSGCLLFQTLTSRRCQTARSLPVISGDPQVWEPFWTNRDGELLQRLSDVTPEGRSQRADPGGPIPEGRSQQADPSVQSTVASKWLLKWVLRANGPAADTRLRLSTNISSLPDGAALRRQVITAPSFHQSSPDSPLIPGPEPGAGPNHVKGADFWLMIQPPPSAIPSITINSSQLSPLVINGLSDR